MGYEYYRVQYIVRNFWCVYVTQTACRVTSTIWASISTKYTSIVDATSLRRIQSLQFGVLVIVSTSCDQFVVGTRFAYRAILDKVTRKFMNSTLVRSEIYGKPTSDPHSESLTTDAQSQSWSVL